MLISTTCRNICLIFAFAFLNAGIVFAQVTDSPQTITVDGQLFEAGSSSDPLLDSSVVMRVQVLNPAKSCILYEEQHTFSTLATNGRFNVQVGSNVGDLAKRTSLDSANAMATVFFNSSTAITGKTSGGGGCSYTPASTDVRHFRFFVTPSTVGSTSQLSPDMRVDSVPQALVAQTLQGLGKDDVFKTSVTSTQAKLDNLLTTNYTNITDLISGTSTQYLRNASTGTLLPTRATDPGSPAAGQLWYDTTSNEIKYYNGTAVQSVGAAGAGISSLTAGSGLAGGTITTSGTISIATGGVTNAMLATGIDASKITAGTLPAGVVPTNTDTTKLPLAGGTMTGAITMGAATTFGGFDLLATGHITMNGQKTITIGRYDSTQQTTLISTLNGSNAGATWYNSTTNKLMYWNGSAAFEIAETTGAGGDITAVNTNAGSGLTGGNTSGPITLAINVDNSTIEIATNTVQLKDLGITTAKIADNAITTAKIADNNVTNAKIASMNITKLTQGAGDYFAYMPAGTECATGEVLKWNAVSDRWLCDTDATGATDHGALTGLGDDDHTQYVMLAGRAGGQIVRGGTASGDDITIESTSDATKGDVILQPTGGNVGIGTTTPITSLNVEGGMLNRLGNTSGTGLITSSYGSIGGSAQQIITNPSMYYHAVYTAYGNHVSGVDLYFNKSRSADGNTPAIVNNNDYLAGMWFYADDGTGLNTSAAGIAAQVDGTPSAGDMPGRLVFYTTSDGSPYVTERMRITNSGNVAIGTTTPLAKLDVNGSQNIREIASAAAPTPVAGSTFIYADNSTHTLKVSNNGSGYVDLLTTTSGTPLVSANSGTAASPSIRFSGDPDTGIWNGSADVISFATAGVNRLNINSTTMTSTVGSGPALNLTTTSAAAPAYSFNGDSDTGWFNPAANTLAASTNGTEKVRIDSSGNVGVGTTNPASKLDIHGSDESVGINIQNNDSSAPTYPGVWVTNFRGAANAGAFPEFSLSNARGTRAIPLATASGTNLGNMNWWGYGTSDWTKGAEIRAVAQESFTDTTGATNLELRTTPTGTGGASAPVTRMTIMSTGNVGIGTTSPSSLLHLRSATPNIEFTDSDTNADSRIVANSATGSLSIQADYNNEVANSNILFNVDASELMRLNSGGNIGFSVTSPNYFLSLSGESARTVGMERELTADTAGNNLTVLAGGATSAATDKNGGHLYLSSGTATGSGSSNIYFQTAASGTSGTTDRTPSTAMSILGSGSVGIGTTVPDFSIGYSSPTRILGIAGDGTASASATGVIVLANNRATPTVGDTTGSLDFASVGNGAGVAQLGARMKSILTGTGGVNGFGHDIFFATKGDNAAGITEKVRITSDGKVGIGTTDPVVALDLNTRTDGVRLPQGTTAQQPTGANGIIRYNTTTNKLEGYENGAWVNIGDATSNASINIATGMAAAPSLSFTGEADTGFYNSGTNAIGVSAGGAQIFEFSTIGMVSPTTGGASLLSGDGTAATPTYAFAGDTDTGWFRPAADSMAATTAGVERIRIDSTGRIGIGTTAPTGPFQIIGGTATSGAGSPITITGQNGAAGINNGGSINIEAGARSGSATDGAINMKASRFQFYRESGASELDLTQFYSLDSGDNFANINFKGRVTGSADSGARIRATTTQTWVNGSAYGTKLSFETTPNGTATPAERMVIDQNGFVGIGTTGPTTTIHVRASSGDVANFESTTGTSRVNVTSPNGNSQLTLRANGSWNWNLINDSGLGGDLRFNREGTDYMIINDTGSVGIGTTNPVRKLHVVENGSSGAAVRIDVTDDNDSSKYFLSLQRTRTSVTPPGAGFGGGIYFSGEGFTDGDITGMGSILNHWEVAQTNDTTSRDSMISFSTSLDGALAERVRISSAGNVGIGTTNPTRKLDVAGTITSTGSDAVYTTSAWNRSYEAAHGSAIVWPIGAGDRSWAIGKSSNPSKFYIFNSTANDNSAAANFVMTMDNSGNVGIGTTSPSYKLSVYDDTAAAAMEIYNSNSAGDGIDIRVNAATPSTSVYYMLFRDSGMGIDGTIRADGSGGVTYNTTSDIRLKTNIRPTRYGLKDLLSVDVNDYRFVKANKESTGFIAQQLLDVYPEAVTRGGENFEKNPWTVDYGRVTPLIVAGIKEMNQVLDIQSAPKDKASLTITSSGHIGIGTTDPSYKLDVSGDLRITGTPYRTGGDIAWQVPSDARLKDVSGSYEHGLNELLQLDIIRFYYKENNPVGADTSKEYTGVLAQQVEKVIPEAVTKDPKSGFLSLNTTPIFWSLVNAVKDLYGKFLGHDAQLNQQSRSIASLKNNDSIKDNKIKELEKKNADQEKELKDLKERLERIEKLLQSK